MPASTARVPAQATAYVWAVALTAALGGLLFGYDWVVIGGARAFYEIYFGLRSPALVGWANSCALLGCLGGSLAAGALADRYGRRPVLLGSAVLFAVSSVLTGSAATFAAFIVWRIVGGVAIGLSSNVAPVYIAEMSPPAVRGRLVSLNQFAIVAGILLAQVVNWRLARPVAAGLSAAQLLASWNVQHGWRWMFFAVAVPAVVFLLASLCIPESPRWLAARHRDGQASQVLTRLGGAAYAAAELAAMRTLLAAGAQGGAGGRAERGRLRELLTPGVRRLVLLGMALAALQQWTGINVLFNYAAEVYRSAGYGADEIFLNIVVTGVINLLFTVLAMLLVDRVGRRPLMIFGALGIGVSHLLCAWAYRAGAPAPAVLVLTLSAIACYALTLAPVTWVLIAEIFPNRVRALGVSSAVSALWIASFVLTYSFPYLERGVGSGGVFLLYGVVCLAGCVLVALAVPETRGRSLEEMGPASATAG